MVDQEKIHNQCLSDDPEERIHALKELKFYFSYLLDKQQAWNDLHRLTSDENSDVRSSAVEALCSVLSQVPDKQQAWNDFLRLIIGQDPYFKACIAHYIGSIYSDMPSKQQAWNDLIRLLSDQDHDVREWAGIALDYVLSDVPNKQQAWNDLIRLFSNQDSDIGVRTIDLLGDLFSYMPDKQQVWTDLIRLLSSQDSDIGVRTIALLQALSSYVPDKQQAWTDLIRFLSNQENEVRFRCAIVILDLFSKLPDKQQAWNDLIKFINNQDSSLRAWAILFFGYVFSDVPDKQQAWNNLYKLTSDEDTDVKAKVTSALGSVFSDVPDKQQAWNDLLSLTNDENSSVRSRANHSLGRVCIFKASQAKTDEDYKKELEKAIEFFEIAAKEAPYYNPAQFCLPFYRSFHTIIFKKQEAREEVNKYLEEAKDAIEGSESKKQLFEAVENLAEALKEVQNLEKLDLQAMKGELNFYRKYCDHAAELMKCTDEKAPFATKVLRKGLPILDRNLRAIIKEIQEKAKNTYKQSQGTVTEKIAYSVCREVQKWEMGSPEEMTQMVEDIAYVLKKKIGYVSENEYVLNKIEAMRYERNLIKQYEALLFVIEQIPTITVVPEDAVIENINKVGQGLETKLDSLSQEMNEIRISLSPGIKQEIEISSGIEILGTGAALITTIPLQEISYAEIKEDLQRIKGEHINKLSELPKRLANKIKGYLFLKDREDIIEQLT